jgi:hypothetical protein
MKRMVSTTLVIAALAVPGMLQAQACIGVPSVDRQFGLAGAMGFTEGQKMYGGELSANLAGPISVGAGYGLVKPDNVDTNGNHFQGRAAWEMSMAKLSVCPTSGVGYTRFHEEEGAESATVTAMVIPVGLGFGKSLRAGENMQITLSAVPQYLYIKNRMESSGTINLEAEDSESAFGADFGVNVGMRSWYVGGGASFTSVENSDPVFSVGLGILFGGDRSTRVSSR